jgi:polar amino acid transport system permease protein
MTPDDWQIIAQGVVTTLTVTIAAFAIGAVFGLPVVALRLSPVASLRWIARAFIEVVRGVPLLIWIFLVFNGPIQFDPSLVSVFTPWRSAVAAMALVSAAYMAEIYRGSLTAIKKGQFEASHALGMTPRQAAISIIGPQMVRVAIPASATYAIGLLKDSSLASTIGVFEITYYANKLSTDTSSTAPFFVAAIYYLVLTVPSVWGARRLDGVLRQRVAR